MSGHREKKVVTDKTGLDENAEAKKRSRAGMGTSDLATYVT